jgi:hypothetical protein
MQLYTVEFQRLTPMSGMETQTNLLRLHQPRASGSEVGERWWQRAQEQEEDLRLLAQIPPLSVPPAAHPMLRCGTIGGFQPPKAWLMERREQPGERRRDQQPITAGLSRFDRVADMLDQRRG